MKVRGLVSCVIPTYKRNDMLPRAIESVLSQTYNNLEILIIDDNEPGDEYFQKNIELLKKYSAFPNIYHITQEHHTNGAIARNIGIQKAKGEFLAFLDDDDVWLCQKLEKQIEYLNSHKDCGAVSCLYRIYSNGNIVGICHPYTSDDLLKKVLLREVAICTPTFCARTEIVQNSRCFDPSLKRHQDLQFYVDFLNISTIEPINETLVYVYADSTMNRPNTKNQIEYKRKFFESIDNTLSKLDKTTKRRVYNAHYFEIAFTALKEKKYLVAVKYILKVGFNIRSYIDVIHRFKNRG